VENGLLEVGEDRLPHPAATTAAHVQKPVAGSRRLGRDPTPARTVLIGTNNVSRVVRVRSDRAMGAEIASETERRGVRKSATVVGSGSG